MIKVLVQVEDFDAGAEVAQLRSTASGAIVQFLGVMRDNNQGDTVASMHLEHYPGMTESSIERIVVEASERWSLFGCTVIHRVGTVLPGEQIVLVAVSAAHRHAAFQACEFVMDYLKTQAPFWKKEQLHNGESRWVDVRESDDRAAARWQGVSRSDEL